MDNARRLLPSLKDGCSRFIAVAFLLASQGAPPLTCGAEPPTLNVNSVQGLPKEISLRLEGGKYEFVVQADTSRGVRFVGIQAVDVVCAGKRIKPPSVSATIQVKGVCTVSVVPDQGAETAIMEIPGELDSGSTEVTLVFPREGFRWSMEIMALGVIALVLFVGGAVWVYLKATKSRSEAIRAAVEQEPWVFEERQRAPQAVAAASRLHPEPYGRSAAVSIPPSSVPPPSSAQEKEISELRASVQRLELALRTVDSAQRALIPELDSRLQRFLVDLPQEVAEVQRDVERANRDAYRKFHDEVSELRDVVGNLHLQMTTLHERSRTGLVALLRELPANVLDRQFTTQTTDGKTLATRTEEALARYFAAATTNTDISRRFVVQVDQLHEAVSRFQKMALALNSVEAEEKLRPLVDDLVQVREELVGIASNDSRQRLRLMFAVDIAPHEAARQTIADSIASGLQREIMKLENIDEYYEKRLIMVATRAAAECSDYADTRINPERNRADVQQTLTGVLTAGGLAEIAPSRNDQFVAVDHTMLQMTRCVSPADRRGAVAQLVARGIRRGDRVLRKATVIVFD